MAAFVLQTTAEDVTYLRMTAAALEDEVMARYEDFLYYDSRRIDETKWKRLRKEDQGDMHVFQERRKRGTTGTASPISPSTVCELEPQASLAAHSSIGRVLATGVIPGTLDDALLGSSFHDTPSLRKHEHYLRGNAYDCTVLLKIDGPTKSDPFRFLGVTWHVHHPLLARTRDCVLLHHTHLTTLREGERIGVTLRHSIEHRDIGDLRGIAATRVMLSSVTFYRQLDEQSLEVFGIEFLDLKRHAPESMQRHDIARDLLLSTTRVCDMGLKKKLQWLLHQERRSDDVFRQSDHGHCAVCSKPTRKVFSASGGPCHLCTKYVCAHCTMPHDMIVDASTPDVVTKSFKFCVECVLLAKQVSGLRVAQSAMAHHY